MGVFFGFFLVFTPLFLATAAADSVCADSYDDLDLSPRLSAIKPLFSESKQIAMVNETKGSFIMISALDERLSISFFTSGLFDLFPIRKDGPLTFCDDGEHLVMKGLGRSDTFTIVNGGVHMGDGGAKRNFANGEMPELLKKLHKIEVRGLASEQK